ncbi:hypothetical protein GH714_022512 [Hevea brasiliensis]|nr:hypothetical protein GH714_022512 [Hevea brasiliensis]
MNSRTRLEGSGSKAANGIHRRVRTLKKLIPNSEAEGLEGLFRDSADYILSLQMIVKVMQIMVKPQELVLQAQICAHDCVDLTTALSF